MAGEIYREYDPAALWAQYDNSRMVTAETHRALRLERQRRSAAVRQGALEKNLDVRFGPHARERLDLFLPQAKKPPLYVYIHGGYWQKNDKENYAFVAEALVPAGIAVAVVEYALCPAVTLPELIQQVRRAVGHLWKFADDYGYDRKRILLSGHSAGGHLAAMLLATNWPDVDPDLPPDTIAAALPISGIYDLEPIRHTPLNDAVRLTRDDVKALSPMFLKPTRRVPVCVAVGGLESREFNRQAADFARTLKDGGLDVRLRVVPEVNHYTIVLQLSDPAGVLFKEVLRLTG